ncbi:longitudinals lacking protein, isoforms A/B/D/L-like isoform X3 [Danaus plexippus]|uniref:longitudinals lacking protein, isoforms A/B/D/L-like isoform X3 n=1 Tax=Danaus plexippus TaxID=13037 RepID=UPI002AB20605|nr:longitudinals lacking protein, isoforms A/B/D/L-like isoform X3 [Danaus plexippus]
MDDDQQFCLRWNNHQSTLVSVFDTLLVKEIHVDCTLAAEGRTLKAHKVVLSACSPYFESVLSEQFDKHPIIILKDVKFAELRAMMDYMYRGEVNISQDQLAALLKAAESLQIKGLSDNKPSRPPSRPPPAPAHPPRAPSPPPQTRDGSSDSRSGSLSPSRRRKKARRTSSPVPPAAPAPAASPEPPCKEELARDVEDLTLDDAHTPPADHNDVVRNFQWHMERSQDEIMNSNDSVRENQGAAGEEALVRLGGLSWEQWSARLALPLAGGGTGARAAPPPALGEPSFTCPDCGRVYKLKSSLRNHQKWECGKEPQFQCPYCVYRAKQKMHIARHMERMHREVHLKPEQYIKQDNVDACT